MLTRRELLAAVAATAGAIASGRVAAATPREDDRFAREYMAVLDAYLADLKAGEVERWTVSYSAHAPPKRLRLARLYVELRELADPNAVEEAIRDATQNIWLDLFSLRWQAEEANRAATVEYWSQWQSSRELSA